MCDSPDRRVWSLEANGAFSVKSLVDHLSFSSPLDKQVERALCKSKSPRRVNITVWIMIFGLFCGSVMQRNLPAHILSPSACPLCLLASADLQHLLLYCNYAGKCWQHLFSLFNLSWVFGCNFRDNVLQILVGPQLKSSPRLLWNNVVKALLTNLWFEKKSKGV